MNTSMLITSAKNRRSKISVLTIFVVILIIPVGCAQNYGRLQRSKEVDKIFKVYQVLPAGRSI